MHAGMRLRRSGDTSASKDLCQNIVSLSAAVQQLEKRGIVQAAGDSLDTAWQQDQREILREIK
jgi:hypothetical protein